MAIPANKQQLILAIETNFKKLKKSLAKVEDKIANEKVLVGHLKNTKMSICNLLVYLIGWQKLVLKWNKKFEKNEMPDLPETNFKWNELGLLAQKFYTDFEHLTFEELKTELNNSTKKILNHIKTCSNKKLYETFWYKNYTKGRMIQINTASPF